METNKKIVLILTIPDGIDGEEVIDTLNSEILCRLEEDDKVITTWEWIY